MLLQRKDPSIASSSSSSSAHHQGTTHAFQFDAVLPPDCNQEQVRSHHNHPTITFPLGESVDELIMQIVI
jgi:hypothetical protein